MYRVHIRWFGILGPLLLSLFWAGTAQGEIYFGGMGGINLPNNLSNVRSSGEFPDNSIPDANLGTASMAGGKLGFYLPNYQWMGFEVEGFWTAPEFTPWVNRGVDADLQVVTLGLNVLFRYPGDTFQPYLGAGAGLFWGQILSDLSGPALASNATPGFNILGGFRGFITHSLAGFVEYKFNYVEFNFLTRIFGLQHGFKSTYSANIIAAGLAWHFR